MIKLLAVDMDGTCLDSDGKMSDKTLDALKKAAEKVKGFISVELSMGQMIEDVKLATDCKRPVVLCNRSGGMIPSPEQVLESIENLAKENK